MADRNDYMQWRALSSAFGTTSTVFTPDGASLAALWHRSNAEVIVLAPWRRGVAVQVDESMILPNISLGQFTGRLSASP